MRLPAEPALGFLELSSLARGPVVVDAMVKRAPVRVLASEPASDGKLLILARGDEASMFEAMLAGEDAATGVLLGTVCLPDAHPDLWHLLAGLLKRAPTDAVGLVETRLCAAAILGADLAAKAAAVQLLELRLARGIGGKGLFTFTGHLSDVQAALDAARTMQPDHLVAAELIARPHDDLTRLYWTHSQAL